MASEGRSEIDESLINDAMATVKAFDEGMSTMEISIAIKQVWSFISRANKYIDETGPWALAKDEAKKQELANVMYNLVESLRIISGLIFPFMPVTAAKVWQQLNMAGTIEELRLDDISVWGKTPAGLMLGEAQQLFPRIELEGDKQAEKAQAAKQAAEAKAAKKARREAQKAMEAAKAAARAAEGNK